MSSEVSVAIIRLSADLFSASVDNVDVVLLQRHDGVQLPRATVHSFDNDAKLRAADIAHDVLATHARHEVGRALHLAHTNLYCVPVYTQRNAPAASGAQFVNMTKLASAIDQQPSGSLNDEVTYHVRSLVDWLRGNESRRGVQFTRQLFTRSNRRRRLGKCVHNPGSVGERRACINSVREKRSSLPLDSSQLDSSVAVANNVTATLMLLDKCLKLVMNPLYQGGMSYEQTVEYYARDRPHQVGLHPLDSATTTSSGESNHDGRFMLHRHAHNGDSDALMELIALGHDVNEQDIDSWTPVHYAAWYNHLNCVGALVSHGPGCNVNSRTKNGSTPLHLAACVGNHYVVQLLLSHGDLDINSVDKNGKTPLDLCQSTSKEAWQACAAMLRAALSRQSRRKMPVELMDGSMVMTPMVNDDDTTAAQLHEQVCDELQMPHTCRNLFKIWICSPNLELQLKDEHKPETHIARWARTLKKFSDSQALADETPKLIFRRDTRTPVDVESTADLSSAAHNLLYAEALHNYLHGFYPCSEQDVIVLGAIIMQILHGNYTSSKADKQFLANENTRKKLIPAHRLAGKASTVEKLVSRIVGEHKHVTERGSRSVTGLQANFLSFCWKLVVYGSTWFSADMYQSSAGLEVLIGVNDVGVHLLNAGSRALIKTHLISTLRYVYEPDKPFIDFSTSTTTFRIRTNSASMVVSLLNQCKQRASK